MKKFHVLQKADGFNLEIRKIINPKQPLPQKISLIYFSLENNPKCIMLTKTGLVCVGVVCKAKQFTKQGKKALCYLCLHAPLSNDLNEYNIQSQNLKQDFPSWISETPIIDSTASLFNFFLRREKKQTSKRLIRTPAVYRFVITIYS